MEVPERGPRDRATRLYEAHSEWLLQYCRRQLGDRDDAEDAVQTTFLYAFRALRRGVVPECERAWLTTIARNVCHSQRRTRQRHPESPELELDRIALAQPDREEAGFLDDVRSALAALPENQRRALVLREWHGASSDEIATELELSEPATHALLFRARRSFTNAMSASRRSVAGLNVAALLEQLRLLVKPLLGGATAKAAVATTAAGVLVGGVVLEQRADRASPPAPERPVASVTVLPPSFAPGPRVVAAPSGEPSRRARPQAGTPAPARREQEAATRGRSSAVASSDDEAAERFASPPKSAEPPESATPPPPRSDAPSPPAPEPLPPVTPPLPPIDLPPIVGEDPPARLAPPVDELLPPIELPPVDQPPAPSASTPQPPLP